MKIITSDWLRSAHTDLETIDEIINNENLTSIVAFHAQQCVEKNSQSTGVKDSD